jgi:hypothetical protein
MTIQAEVDLHFTQVDIIVFHCYLLSDVCAGSLQQQLLGLSVAPTAGSLAAAGASKGLTTMQPVPMIRQKQVLQQLRPTMVSQ